VTRDQLFAELTATRRRQRLALLVALSPFYLAFALGWIFRNPTALFVGAVGFLAVAVLYWRFAPSHRVAPRIDHDNKQETEQ
tara:strand:+ start:22644 stop:22889 length:246 start_codon:yes stop_codon:yes gene_type:complete